MVMAAEVHTKIIRNFAVVGHFKRRESAYLPTSSEPSGRAAQGIGGIDRCGGDGFGGSHAHLGAGQRKNHGHAESGACAGIEVGGERDDGAGVDQFARGCVVRSPRWKQQPGSSVQTTFESARARISPRIDLFEMVGTCGVQLDREACGSCVGELFGMDARHQAAGSPGNKNLACLRDCECPAIAENIAKLRQPGHRDRGNPAVAPACSTQAFGALAKFRRYDVSAKERNGNIQRLFLMQIVEEFQDFKFVFPVEAVAALCFERRGSMSGEFAEENAARALSEVFGEALRRCSTVERIPPPLREISS